MAHKNATPESRKEEVLGILMMTLGILMFIGLITYNSHEHPGNISEIKIQNKLGVAGVYIAHYLIQFGLGYPSLVLPFIIFLTGWNLFRGAEFYKSVKATVYLLAFAVYTSVILAIPEVASRGGSNIGFSLSGLIGGLIAQYLFNYLGIAGSIVFLLSLII